MTSPNSTSKPGGLLARLFGLGQPETSGTPQEPSMDAGSPEVAPGPSAEESAEMAAGAAASAEEIPELASPLQSEAPVELAAPAELCPICQTPRKDGLAFCADCGWLFGSAPAHAGRTTATAARATPTSASASAGRQIKDRYQINELINEKSGVSRYRGLDLMGVQPIPVVIIESPLPQMAETIIEESEPAPEVPENAPVADELLPTFEDISLPPIVPPASTWPSLEWEKAVLEKARHPALPEVIDYFTENNCEYLIESNPEGAVLWDGWDDPEADAGARYGWLKQVAEALHALHGAGAILEGLRPSCVTVTSMNQAVITDLSGLLPCPVPVNAPIRGTLYTAPELILSPQEASARSDLYSFGAMIYALEYLHHDLEEKDFESQFTPKLITDRYPDVHPTFFRLVCKTFVRDINTRFPTDEAGRTDPTGFAELIKTLETCRRTLDRVRLDVAAWTTTGMVRTGNEDALTLLHGIDSRQDDVFEYAMVLLADGMGGYEAGEVAAAMAMDELKKYLLQQPQFAALAGKEQTGGSLNVEECKKVLEAALKHVNKAVFTAARAPGRGRRGMGCTAEAVYIDARNVVVGHVGDSRTYHLHNGRLVQLTRDQTLVNRLVELGQLTAEEAENHPRKNELQQAIGGQPEVIPGLYHGQLKPGDWVLVCSDGLTNHIPPEDLAKMLSGEACDSAEKAARRLLNLVNIRGATDNATLIVVRAT
jgi:serine/threonine protein phosphatase PrpC